MGKVKLCIICNNVLNGNRTKYCSNKCSSKGSYLKNKRKINNNTYYRQISKYRYRKFKLIELRNNHGCDKCGYIKNISALDFHHIDPSSKCFPLDARNLSNRKWEDILNEFNKCKILCANCHREEHYPELLFEHKDNFYKNPDYVQNKCLDCNITISYKAKRCKKCNNLNRRVVDRPDLNILLKEVNDLGYVGTSKKYNVSDNTIRKWINKDI